MSFLFVKKPNIDQAAPSFSSVRIGTSCFGKPIPICYGLTRVAANLLWCGNFQPIAHYTQENVGGKGGSSKITTVEYTYQIALMMGLCEGPMASFGHGYAGREIYEPTKLINVTVDAQETFSLPQWPPFKVTVSRKPIYAITNVYGYYWTQGPNGDVQNFNVITPDTYTFDDETGEITFTNPYAGTVVVTYQYIADSYYIDALEQMGLIAYKGSHDQTVWPYLTTYFPEATIAYRGLAYVASEAYQLGDSADIPNTSIEVQSTFSISPTIRDANPKDVIADLLTNPYYGGYFPSNRFGDLSDFGQYCLAAGLYISPAYVSATALSNMLVNLAVLTNSDYTVSDRKLKLVPYADQSITNPDTGATWNPNLTAVYDFTEDDFIPYDNGMVKLRRKSPQDRYNTIRLRCYDRGTDTRPGDYVETIIEAKDPASIERNGPRIMSEISALEICDINVAARAAQLILQRCISVNNEYVFQVSMHRCLLDPMDLVTINEPDLGLNQALVRVIKITESDEGYLEIEVEEVPVGAATSILYPHETPSGYRVNYAQKPQAVQAPFIFEAPTNEAGETGLAIWAAVCGQENDPLWGGAFLWVSYDGSTYQQIGMIKGGARYGTLRSAMGSSGGLQVQLVGKGGQMFSGTPADALNRSTLLYVANQGSGEFLSYETATLVAANQYDLGGAMQRGQLNTPAAAATSGSKWARIDQTILHGPSLTLDHIGQTIYLKFQSFNVFSSGAEDIADVEPYTYVIRGNIVLLPPSTVTNLRTTMEQFGIRILWDRVVDGDLDYYDLRIGGSSWETATQIFKGKTDNYLWAAQTSGQYTIRIKAFDLFGNASPETTITPTFAPPEVSSPNALFSGPDYVLSWQTVAGVYFAIAGYEIRYGSDWASGTLVARVQTSQFRAKATWLGNRHFMIGTIDVAGNYSTTKAGLDLEVIAPSAPQSIYTQVIDNNVLIYWSPPAGGNLPIDRYEVKKNGEPIGSNGASTFTTYFEQASGNYTYSVTAYDSAGNAGAEGSINAQVNSPPDYSVQADQIIDFASADCTVTNAFKEAGSIFGIVDTSKTWDQHFSENSWASPQAQIDAGKPLYFQPSVTSGQIAFKYNYGQTILATLITTTITKNDLAGAVVATPTIKTSQTGAFAGEETTYAGVSSAYGSNFQYVKIIWDLTATGGDDFTEVAAIGLRLALKEQSDSGLTSIDNTQTDPVITFNKAFLSAPKVTGNYNGSAAYFPVFYGITGLQCNCRVYDTAGNRPQSTLGVMWQAKGV